VYSSEYKNIQKKLKHNLRFWLNCVFLPVRQAGIAFITKCLHDFEEALSVRGEPRKD
jgi:hypothetical protein